MRKKLLQFSLTATILLFGACSNEGILPDTEVEAGRTISLTATMPNEGPSTRLALEQEGKDIKVTWEIGDVIELAFVQGINKIKEAVEVSSISADGKKAYFDIPIPEGATGEFKLYGVYGGNGLYMENPNPIAILPTNAGNAGTLEEVESRKDVMLYFEHDMQVTDTQASVTFQHLGSLFSLTLNNIGQIPSNIISEIREVRLVGLNGDGEWAYNSGNGGNGIDLETGEFFNAGLFPIGNYINFNLSSNEANDETITAWGWYPMTGKVWPELQLQLTDEDGISLITSNNTKGVKTLAPIAGMSYHFYAKINLDQSLSFTNDQFVVVP
ncbi:MAG: hypothetical protein ACOH2V_14375 [Candidatus Saccharimonadaceae bacterium]